MTPTKIEQDEFLQAPALFRHGPWMLLVLGSLLAVAFFVAAKWRIEASRKDTYVAAYQLTSATAAAVQENAGQLLARLRQASYSVQSRQPPAGLDEVRRAFQDGLGLRGSGIDAIGLDESGNILASTSDGVRDPDLARLIVEAAGAQQMRKGGQMLLPESAVISRGSRMPVVHRVGLGDVEYIAYFMESTPLSKVVAKAFEGKQGWLRLEDRQGALLFQAWSGRTDAAAAHSQVETVESLATALAHPTDFASSRLLVSHEQSPHDALKVVVGLREADALVEFKKRVDATWMIAWVAGGLLLSLVGLTALAIKKFASKEQYLRRLATIDILTGLPNRRSFQELLARSLAQANKNKQTMGLMFIDLDNFKYINDAMGHDAGDTLLQHVAEVLRKTTRRGDRVCRLGGDEFTVILNDLPSETDAQHAAERVLADLSMPLAIRGVEIQTKASVGVALFPLHAQTGQDLMRYADTAMYQAKQEGKSRALVYNESMAAKALSKAETVRELANAIAHDELFLVFQPKFSLTTGLASGYEALVRWRHPVKGLVFPGDFIPLAEESGLIVDLGNWVLEHAVRQIRSWHDEGRGWQSVAVNVSALQLRGADFIARVQQVLATHGVPGQHLQVELTESSLAADTVLAQSLVQRLRTLGVSVAIDDFGTGYSSLGALQKFEIDCLKVDRSFVNSILTAEGEEICRAVVTLGHAMNMRVVAEGVETAAQRDALRKLGCDEVQGYFFAKPVSAVDAAKFAGQRHPEIEQARPVLVAA